jgi:hypothetical protein
VSRAAIPIAIWGSYLGGLALMLGLWGRPDVVGVILMGGASLEALLIAGWVALLKGSAQPGAAAAPSLWAWAIPLAVGLACVVDGLQVGLWLLLIGAGLVLLGLVGVARTGRGA